MMKRSVEINTFIDLFSYDPISTMDVKSIADILGHSNVMITVNRYAHSFLDYKIQMMNKLDNQIFNTAI